MHLILDEKGIAALQAVIDYNWNDELEDFRDHPDEPDCHVFAHLNALQNLILGTRVDPKEYLKEQPWL